MGAKICVSACTTNQVLGVLVQTFVAPLFTPRLPPWDPRGTPILTPWYPPLKKNLRFWRRRDQKIRERRSRRILRPFRAPLGRQSCLKVRPNVLSNSCISQTGSKKALKCVATFSYYFFNPQLPRNVVFFFWLASPSHLIIDGSVTMGLDSDAIATR